MKKEEKNSTVPKTIFFQQVQSYLTKVEKNRKESPGNFMNDAVSIPKDGKSIIATTFRNEE